MNKICIIGAGKLGQGFAQLFTQLGKHAELVTRDSSEQARAVSESELIFLTVQDAAIESLCESLIDAYLPGQIVCHCSGALSSNALASASKKGALVASAHPLNSFPSTKAALVTFSNQEHKTACFLEGDKTAVSSLDTLMSSAGFNVFHIEKANKVAYHAACVTACNYLVVLMEQSLQLAESAGLKRDDFWQALQPILSTTLNNISRFGTTQSLSGPIERGDMDTVEKHLSWINSKPELNLDLYKSLGQAAIDLAVAKRSIDHMDASKLKTALSQSRS